MTTPTAGTALTALADRIDDQDWEGLRALLAPTFTARYAHTGERFGRDEFVGLNRDYPASWAFKPEAVVDTGPEAVLRARVSDATGSSPEAHYVASFGRVDDAGLLTELVEIWAEVIPPLTGERRPDSAVGDRS